MDRAGVVGIEGWVVRAGTQVRPGALTLTSPYGEVSAWRVRDDPALPGLRPALDTASVGAVLHDLGVAPAGLRLELLAYRPERRAVVAATTPTHELYFKCVPPAKAEALHRRHVACAAAGLPVPEAVGYDAGLGLLLLTPLHGDPLRPALMSTGAVLPPPDEVADLQAGFARVDLDLPARAVLRQVRGHAQLLRAVLPAAADRVDDLVGRIDPRRRGEAEVVVHGDFYDDQVLLRDGHVSGVVDVDGAGLGHPADDAGNLLAHLLLLRRLVPTGAGVHSWLPAVADVLHARHDPDELHRRTAAVLVGLGTWPHSRQTERWQDETGEILELAERALDGHL